MTLHTSVARLENIEPTFQEKALMRLADPNLAYLLFLAGLAGLYFELANPGAIFPGIAGALSLLLGLYAMQMLPVNLAGLLLILLAVLFLILEIFVSSGGLLAIAGLLALFAGSLMLFSIPGSGIELSLFVFLPVFLVFTALTGFLVSLSVHMARSRKLGGKEEFVGETGTVIHEIGPHTVGKFFVHGELWDATAKKMLEKGVRVRVVGMEGLQIEVTRVDEKR